MHSCLSISNVLEELNSVNGPFAGIVSTLTPAPLLVCFGHMSRRGGGAVACLLTGQNIS